MANLNKLAIGAIAKNEHFGLKEWVAYHRVVGVEHFYIYDNDSMIPVAETLAREIGAGYVTCIPFPGLSRQMPAYNDCLVRFGQDNAWIAFIDCDEFLLPKEGDSVPEILNKYFVNYGSLQVNWVLFGSNKHEKRPEGLVIENYIKATTSEYKDNLHTKAIVQPNKTICAGSNPHHFLMKPGFFAVGENFEGVSNAWSRIHSVCKLQINHYTNKSKEDFLMKISKGRADAAHLPTVNLDNFNRVNEASQVEDTTILRFLDRTKAAML